MKSLFGFVLLVASALLLLTIIQGIGGIFSSISATWQPAQTAEVGSALSQVLWLGGIVFVMVLGFGLYTNVSKGAKNFSRPQHDPEFQVLDNPAQRTPALLAGKDVPDWYDFADQEEREDYRSVLR